MRPETTSLQDAEAMCKPYVCIHGHFYQPPRENPWSDMVECQPSASPYHDWNERITRQCYGPNAHARLPGEGGRILALLNNYEYMSFNFGPTLLSWLERFHPRVYLRILEADRAGIARYRGHGNALAQVYNHMIMPLAGRRDKLTQIRWGLTDFTRRFGRPAEGMWLAETAVDTETLDLMAREGVRFTILSPSQAAAVRPLDRDGRLAGPWHEPAGEGLDVSRPYRVILDREEHRHMDVFFYDGALSRAVSYEKALSSGETFLDRIVHAFDRFGDGPRLISVATDGETYGHHFKFGDMALAWLFDRLDAARTPELTNYGLFLERFPPDHEVKLVENSSWSCAHGVERWRSDCGCSVAGTPGWNQAWRGPLREGLTWLSAELARIFETHGGRLLKDPWEARDRYVSLFSEASPALRNRFLDRHQARTLDTRERVHAMKLLESQRMALYMCTSCGWFFDDISGIETVQVLRYAARAIELASRWAEQDLEAGLLVYLARAESNDAARGDGAMVYRREVWPARIDPSRAAAHYALAAAVGGEGPPAPNPFIPPVRPVEDRLRHGPDVWTRSGTVEVEDPATGERIERTFAVTAGLGEAPVCVVGDTDSMPDPHGVAERMGAHGSEHGGPPTDEILLGWAPGARTFGPDDLVPDAVWAMVREGDATVHSSLEEAMPPLAPTLRRLSPLIESAGDTPWGIPGHALPCVAAHEIIAATDPEGDARETDWGYLRRLATLAKDWPLPVNRAALTLRVHEFLRRRMESLASDPGQEGITPIIEVVALTQALGLECDLWEHQNSYYDLQVNDAFFRSLAPSPRARFLELGRRLGFVIEGD